MLPNALLRQLYRQMLYIRLVEEAIATNYKEQEMRCPTHLCIGHEAIAVGVCAHLGKTDQVLSNHRSHGHYLAKGGNLSAMIAELYGKADGCSKGRGGSQHLIDLSAGFVGSTPVVGGTIPVATGVAWSNNLQKKKVVTAVFFGDAAVEEGVTHESLNFAALKKLPILYVCENNFYSILTPLDTRQPKRKIVDLAKSYGITSFQTDGNNVLKVYQTAKKAVSLIRRGAGPVFLECITYRHREHCGPEIEAAGLRPQKEYLSWLKKCPVKTFAKYLLKNKILAKKDLTLFETEIKTEIEKAFVFAKNSPLLDEIPSQQLVYA